MVLLFVNLNIDAKITPLGQEPGLVTIGSISKPLVVGEFSFRTQKIFTVRGELVEAMD